MAEPSRSFSTTRLSVSPVGMGSWREAYRSNRRVLSSASTMARERTRIGASVVVSKFATFRYRSPSELRNQNDTRNLYVASVLSIPKFAKRRYRDVANFRIGTLAGCGPIQQRQVVRAWLDPWTAFGQVDLNDHV